METVLPISTAKLAHTKEIVAQSTGIPNNFDGIKMTEIYNDRAFLGALNGKLILLGAQLEQWNVIKGLINRLHEAIGQELLRRGMIES